MLVWYSNLDIWFTFTDIYRHYLISVLQKDPIEADVLVDSTRSIISHKISDLKRSSKYIQFTLNFTYVFKINVSMHTSNFIFIDIVIIICHKFSFTFYEDVDFIRIYFYVPLDF